MMKHPVLARVFSAVLAVMGLLLFINGLTGLRKNGAEHTERLAEADKLSRRITNYVELRRRVEGSASYEEAAAALEKLTQEHMRSAARHKTDTALFTAERGGYQMGEDLIAAAQVQMNELHRELADAESLRALLAGVINQALAERKNSMPWLNGLTNAALKAAGESYQESAKYTLAIAELTALMAAEPQIGETPFMPAPPAEPTIPSAVGPDAGWGWAGSGWAGGGFAAGDVQGLYDAYMQAGSDYTQAMETYAAEWEAYSAAMAEYQAAMAQQSAYAVSAEYYEQAHSAWERECRAVRESVDFGAAASLARSRRSLASTISGSAAAAISALLEGTGAEPDFDRLVDLAVSAQERLEELSGLEPSEMSNEEFLEKAAQAEDVLTMLGDGFTAAAARLSDPGALIAEAAEKMHATDILVQYLEYMLKRAEHEMQAQLENIWYSLGEAEKKRVTLEVEKLGLEEEARILRRETVTTEELHTLKNRHISARQLLLNIPEIKAAAADDGNVEAGALSYLEKYEAETGRLYRGKRILNLLAMAGGLLAFLGIPGAFEKLRARVWLISPVLLCLLCAVGADGLNMALGLGQMYTALFTAIFALLQLLIILPKKRRGAHIPKH